MKSQTLFNYAFIVIVALLLYCAFQYKTNTDLEATINTLATQRDSAIIALDSLKANVPQHYNHIRDAETVLLDTTKLDFFKLKLRPE